MKKKFGSFVSCSLLGRFVLGIPTALRRGYAPPLLLQPEGSGTAGRVARAAIRHHSRHLPGWRKRTQGGLLIH